MYIKRIRREEILIESHLLFAILHLNLKHETRKIKNGSEPPITFYRYSNHQLIFFAIGRGNIIFKNKKNIVISKYISTIPFNEAMTKIYLGFDPKEIWPEE